MFVLNWVDILKLMCSRYVFSQDSAIQPSLVIVYFGGNDAVLPFPSAQVPYVPLPEYVENMKKIAIHLKVNLLIHKLLILHQLAFYFPLLIRLKHSSEPLRENPSHLPHSSTRELCSN